MGKHEYQEGDDMKKNARVMNYSPVYSDEPAQQDQWESYLRLKRVEFSALTVRQAHCHLVREANWLDRKQYKNCQQLGVRIRIGDICYIDFGQAYLNEAGFQHFGVILSFCNGKAFVVPMTSNPVTFRLAYDPQTCPQGRRHLMRIGLIEGMKKESVLFLNDCKYINTARIIDVKASIPENSELFSQIVSRVKECLML